MNLLKRFWLWWFNSPQLSERRIETDPTEPPPPVLRRQPIQDVGGMGPPDDDD